MTFAVALIVAAISGFIALSYEILWYRVIAFASWGLPGAFGLLLAAYLFGLAIGSRVAGAFCKDDAQAGDTRQLRLLAVFAFVANLGDLDLAFTGEERRVDHVHRVRMGAHHAGQNRRLR